ncbi:hypothetical protein N7492_000019 [Penicillium capsulatum]|uniref:SANT domain-containing protein n=1 Tax=Penicillium capsulatum TaxID=69766 RepID=A0A9W9IQH9_9EURO|nr:hypothetical protein N7492_000019 [Penicillium capsulatum]
MSSRFPSQSGFNSRDRSPPRFGDRRPLAGPRGPDDGSPSFGREPPRGPRALVDSPRGGHFGAGRGRGYGRGDFRDRDRDLRDRERDRDFRDPRDAPPFRRDMDRDWGRRDRDFDPRDTRGGFGRGRSRSPTRDFRDLRDLREPPGRDFDLVRMRRNSRDSILSASSGGPDGPPSSVAHPRGGSHRGRGRGDWDGGRGRGRPPFHDDREPFRRRSRSRDTWRDRGRDRLPDREMDRRDRDLDRDRALDRERDRDIRERDRERDMDRRDRFDRREDWDSRRPERDDRDRPPEPWKRERPPSRADSRGVVGSTSGSLLQGPSSTTGPPGSDRASDQPPFDHPRKASTISCATGTESRRETDRPEPTPFRPEPSKDVGFIGQNSPPPSAPQVPAFGSVAAPIPAAPSSRPSGSPSTRPTAATEEHPTNDAPIRVERNRAEGSYKSSVQPPTGPKADRLDSSQPVDARGNASDNGHPKEELLRASKPFPQLSERSPPTAPAAMARRGSISAPTEPQMPDQPSESVKSPQIANPARTAPRAVSRDPSTSPRMQVTSIPTGPRADKRQGMSPREPSKPRKAMDDTGFSKAPPVSDALPKSELGNRVDGPVPDDKTKRTARPVSPSLGEEEKKPKSQVAEVMNPPSLASPPMNLPIRNSPPPVPMGELSAGQGPGKVEKENETPIPDFGQPSDEEDEENVLFTQDYLEERRQTFERDMQVLRADMPLSPLEDPTITSLLLKIQLLGTVLHEGPQETPREPVPPVESTGKDNASNPPATERVVTFAPPTKNVDPKPAPEEVVRVAPPTVPHPEITLENLPFLHSGPPTPLSDFDVCQENLSTQEDLRETLRSELSKRQKQIAKKNAALREEYMVYYKPWRLAVWELDRSKDKDPMTPGPVSSPPPPIPVTPAAIPESREGRRYKGNSELDFLNALKASEISAQEELERRRTKMATARPDLSREAVIPDMLEPQQEKSQLYKDVNGIVESSHAMEVFGFLPPPNDFTKEEHEMFTDAFMAYPKKWGKIAEALPGRDFQQCIVHYYLTKEEIKYKAKLNKRWSRRGRSTRTKSARPKSNALIADLGVVKPDFDGEDAPAPVTDTGRPRRAAAPTFGDTNEGEAIPPGRRGGQFGNHGEPLDKPASRRGGRGSGIRAQRRPRTTQQDPKTQGQLPMGSAPLSAVTQIEGVMEGMIEGVLPPERDTIERDLVPPSSRPRGGRGKAREGMYVFETTETDAAMAPRQLETGYGSLQPTSYWSVPEQRDFPRLLAHFGRDFEGISNFMKTKTTVMVKNYFQRRLDSGQTDFDEILSLAEERKARGEPTGPLPVPSVATKRRYEATPSAIVPRPLAPHSEVLAEADEARFSKSKPLAMSPQPTPLHGRPIPDNERGSSRYAPLAQASTATVPPATASLGDEASRGMRVQPGSSRLPGPRLGYFTEDRRESPMLTAPSTARASEIVSSRHTPGPPLSSELTRMEHVPSQAYMPGQPPPLLPTTHSRHPSLTQAPGSPTRPELDISSVHRDPFTQRQYYPLPGQPVGLSQPARPVLSPVKDAPRPSATPAPDSSRQVPAKRSNIMSILNDEPEEPQPRKRFASEQTPSVPSASTSRPMYQSAGGTRPEETVLSASHKSSSYGQPNTYPSLSRGYPEYSSYGSSGGSGTANNDWMARFDPRAQQPTPQSQTQAGGPLPQSGRSATSSGGTPSSFSHYASAPSQPSAPVNSISVPSPAPTPPPGSQRPYSSVFAQPTLGQGPTSASSRDLPSQPPAYRPGSPPPRASSAAYGSRPEHPTTQSSAGLLACRLDSPAHIPRLRHQPMLRPNRIAKATSSMSKPWSMALIDRPRTPPPPAQGGRSIPPLTLGRSYTPPSAIHPSVGGYAPPHPSSSGTVPSLHQRPPAPVSLGETASTPTHHRVYSHGSTSGGLPGPLHPSSQQPR